MRKSIRAAKRMYYLRLFTLHKNDIQRTWCLINSTITNKSKGKLHCEFDLDGKIITNSDEIADAFNEYFVNIGRKLSHQIIPVHQHSHYLDNETNKRMKLEAVNEDNINEAINRLKNKSSYGHDEISNKIIKSAKNSLIQPLMLIINQMLMTGEFPSDLKISRVKPLEMRHCSQTTDPYHYCLRFQKFLSKSNMDTQMYNINCVMFVGPNSVALYIRYLLILTLCF